MAMEDYLETGTVHCVKQTLWVLFDNRTPNTQVIKPMPMTTRIINRLHDKKHIIKTVQSDNCPCASTNTWQCLKKSDKIQSHCWNTFTILLTRKRNTPLTVSCLPNIAWGVYWHTQPSVLLLKLLCLYTWWYITDFRNIDTNLVNNLCKNYFTRCCIWCEAWAPVLSVIEFTRLWYIICQSAACCALPPLWYLSMSLSVANCQMLKTSKGNGWLIYSCLNYQWALIPTCWLACCVHWQTNKLPWM